MSSENPSIHWIGAGLASGPGLVSLANKWTEATVWDMTLERAHELSKEVEEGAQLHVKQLNLADDISLSNFQNTLNDGDIIISMLPATFHVQVAHIALDENCHLVTSSYLSDEMVALNDKAIDKGLTFINEVGLDPGIDHLLTHLIIEEAKNAGVLGKGNQLDFISYCGGFPVVTNDFAYKFSWTPMGVLTALKNPAQLIQNGVETTIPTAWENIKEIAIHGETFEAYANRNSIPFIKEYALDNETNLRTFVRGTLRLSGWEAAWQDIFTAMENATMGDLKNLSDELWSKYQYDDGEEDRVVLYVALTSEDENGEKWESSLTLDTTGTRWQSAMANTVSYTVAEAVSALMENRLNPGVQAAPHDIDEARLWLKNLSDKGLVFKAVNIKL